jgi:amino acid transporter
MVGSIFYCFAAILPAAGVYSIISLFISGLLLNIFRPILLENASAVPYNGGSYSYIVNFGPKSLAVVAAAVTSLDAITTVYDLFSRLIQAIVSAGSAGGYLAGEINLPFPDALLAVFILILFSGICMLGIRESSKIALTIMAFHLVTMIVLAITAIVRWGIIGNSLLSANWHAAQPSSASQIAKQILFGVSLGFLGNTGVPQFSIY